MQNVLVTIQHCLMHASCASPTGLKSSHTGPVSHPVDTQDLTCLPDVAARALFLKLQPIQQLAQQLMAVLLLAPLRVRRHPRCAQAEHRLQMSSTSMHCIDLLDRSERSFANMGSAITAHAFFTRGRLWSACNQ